MKKNIPYALEFLAVSLLGVSLLYFGVINPAYKIHVLSSTCLVASVPFSIRFYRKEWSCKSVGIRLDNINLKTIVFYLLATFIGVGVLLFYSFYYKTEKGASETTLIYYSLIGCVAQEFLFRAYLMRLGESIFGRGFVNYSINVLMFTLMHIVYKGFWHNNLWLLMLLAGVLFTGLYQNQKYQNIFLVIIVHIILNSLAVYLGIFK